MYCTIGMYVLYYQPDIHIILLYTRRLIDHKSANNINIIFNGHPGVKRMRVGVYGTRFFFTIVRPDRNFFCFVLFGYYHYYFFVCILLSTHRPI